MIMHPLRMSRPFSGSVSRRTMSAAYSSAGVAFERAVEDTEAHAGWRFKAGKTLRVRDDADSVRADPTVGKPIRTPRRCAARREDPLWQCAQAFYRVGGMRSVSGLCRNFVKELLLGRPGVPKSLVRDGEAPLDRSCGSSASAGRKAQHGTPTQSPTPNRGLVRGVPH
jgi:hypothetical protein